MAEASSKSEEITQANTTDDFSLVQAGSGDSILKDTSWPQNDDNSHASSQAKKLVLAEESVESNQLYASHYALSTAYRRVTEKLALAEQRNQQLLMQESLRESFRSGKMSGSVGSQTNFAMAPPDVQSSIHQAWEAYNEKCKECQQLREELEEMKQRNNNAEHVSRLKNLQDDVLREKAKQDDVVRRLQKTKMEADHLEKKEILAREELEKEREYQRNLVQIAEKKHREMEQRIDELDRNLANEKSLTEDLRKREKGRQKILEDEFSLRKEAFLNKIQDLEEKNIALKEEVSVLLSLQSSKNGPSTSATQINGLIDGPQHAPESERDGVALEMDIQLLKRELDDLRLQTAEQHSILSTVLQNPRIVSLLSSLEIQNKASENTGPVPTKNCNNAENSHKRKKTSSPKSRNPITSMSIDGNSCNSDTQDIYGPGVANSEQFSPNSRQTPIKHPEDSSNLSVPVIKHAEDIIRTISKEGTLQHRKSAKPPPKNELFPPMDVSRVIHTPEASGPQTMPMNHRSSPEHVNDEFVPTSSQSVLCPRPSGTEPSQYYNGNASANEGPVVNGQSQNSNMRYSLPPMEIDSNQFYSAVPPDSMSSTDTLTTPADNLPSVRPTNPFYQDLTEKGSLVPTLNRNQVPQEPVQNSGRGNKQATMETRNIVEVYNDETPGNRYVPSSDEDSDNDSFVQLVSPQEGGHQPKEFVVPTVVRAGDLVAQGTSNRKAFQDSGYSARQVQPQTRPAMRARPESPTQVRVDHPEGNRNASAPSHQYPSRTNENQGECRTCPICSEVFGLDWSENKMTMHINSHFSDDDM